jgi:hypothetical protein
MLYFKYLRITSRFYKTPQRHRDGKGYAPHSLCLHQGQSACDEGLLMS